MSVLVLSELGIMLDHNNLLKKIYSDCIIPHGLNRGECSMTKYQMKSDFFNIKSAFMMDSQFNKLKAEQTQVESEQKTNESAPAEAAAQHHRKGKKRNLAKMNEGELKCHECHQEIRDTLQKAHEQLVSLAREHGHLVSAEEMPSDNNVAARRAAETTVGPGDAIREMCQTATDLGAGSDSVTTLGACECQEPLWFNTLTVNTSDKPAVRTMLGGSYLIPAQCSFLMSDISNLHSLISSNGPDSRKFDVIVMDPPWYNKSVKRKYKYKMLDDHEVLSIPISELASAHGLIVVWATNKVQQHRFIQDELFPKWKVKHLARWYWLKVTQHGQMVTDLDNNHKKPYETIFLGYKTQDDGEKCTEDIPPHLSTIPNNYVIVSVPSSLHSHKPPLTEILKPYLPENPRSLELFARNLLPGWTSWGNEVLKLQHMDYYEPVIEAQ